MSTSNRISMEAQHVSLHTRRPAAFSEEEWQIRTDLAALYRLVDHFRMTDMIDTHITARLPDENGRPAFLINRYGVLFGEMRASDLVKIDLDGNVIDARADGNPEHYAVNAAGFTIHSAIHAARDDLHFVVHTHTAAGIAVSAQEHGLLPISQHALKFYGKLAYHDYEGIALDLGERQRLVRDFGPHKAMILRNHGLLAGGETAADAFHEIYFLERACQAQIQALAGGTPLRFPPENIRQRTAAQFNREESPVIARRAWLAALRLIDTARSDYRS